MDHSKKTIIFDFGNVLIDLDFDTCFKAFEKILKVDWSDRKLPKSVVEAIQNYDRGHINDDDLISAFAQFNPDSNFNDLVDAWNVLLGEIKPKRFEMLINLRKKYNLCILSNINNLHLIEIEKYLEREYGETNFEEKYFDKVFYSHHIGMRKPDVEIYTHVSKTLGTKDILFIDDLKENIESAISFGWQGAVHGAKDEITDKIQNYLSQAGF